MHKSLNTTYYEVCEIYYLQNFMKKIAKKSYQKTFYINYVLRAK